MVTDLHSTRDCTTAMEHEDNQNGDDESQDETFSRQDNRTYQCKWCPEIFRHLRAIRKHTKLQHPSEWKNIVKRCVHCKRQFPSGLLHDRHVHFHSLDHPFKCTECDQMYRSKKNLEKHYQVFHDRNSDNFSMERFHCGLCELTFVEKKYHDLHSTIYHYRKLQRLKNLSGKVQVCERCVKTFDSRDSLMEHIQQTHQSDPPLKKYICKMCSKDLRTVFMLRIHILVTHFGIMPFVCQHCNAEFSARRFLLKHIEKDHSEVALFKCPFCDESFTTESRMTEHKDRVHKDKVPVQLELEYDPQTGKPVYPCGKCEKKFESKKLLDKHLVKAAFMLMYKCPLCSKSVRMRKLHMRVHHYIEYDAEQHHYLVRYKCHCCSKLFQQKRKLLDHQNALSNECDRCHIRFNTKKSLQVHMATHQSNKSLKCEDCGLECGHWSRLQEHRKRYHSPTSTKVLNIINCPYCPQLFATLSHRTRHIAIIHEQSELKANCSHCPVQVMSTRLLRKHYRTEHPEERLTFKCPECDKYYLNRGRFRDHYKKHNKEARVDQKTEVKCTSEPVEEEVKENGQMNDADGELISIVIKEEAIVQIENASAAGVGATTGINDKSLNTNQPSEQGMMQVASTESEAEQNAVLLLTEERKQEEHMEVDETSDKFAAEASPQRGNKSCKCEDCGLFLYKRRRLEEHRKRYHSPTSTQVLKIINCPYCTQLFSTVTSCKSHIAAKHIRSETKINCGHCPVQMRNSVQLRKHYRMVHPEERVTLICPECKKVFLKNANFKYHYKRHRKKAGSDDNAVMSNTSEPAEDGVKESGQTNDQIANAELESIVINEEAFVQSEPVEDGVNKNDQNANGELEPIVIKEHSIVLIENASASGVNEASGIENSSFNTNKHSEQRLVIEFEQEPLDNGEAADSTDLTEEVQSTEAEKTSEQKSVAMEEQQIYFIKAKEQFQESTIEHVGGKQSNSSVGQQDVPMAEEVEEQMDVDETIDKFATETPAHWGNKSCKCKDCGLIFDYWWRLEKHWNRYHSPTSTQVLKIINCPYCPKLFTTLGSCKKHITAKHVRSEFKVNCGHCPVHPMDSVLLTKHYKIVHPEERVTFKCPECKNVYLYHCNFKNHYKWHRKKGGSDDMESMSNTIEPVEDGVKESGQTNDQTADAQLESIVINEKAFVQSEPIEDGVSNNGQNLNGELESIVVKEESIVQIGNAAASGVNAATGIKHSSFNSNTHSEQRVVTEINQEPLDDKEAANSTEEDQSTDAEGTSEQKSAAMEEQQVSFIKSKKEFQESTVVEAQSKPSVGQQDVPIASDAEEKPVLLTTEEQKQEEQMEVDETNDKFAAEIPAKRDNKLFKCQDCGMNIQYRRRFEEHRKRYHSPTSTQVLKILNCPYCPQLFATLASQKSHIAAKHVRSSVRSKFKVNCAHCPVQVADNTLLLRKHYKTVHPEERVTFKCPECEKVYRVRTCFLNHYKSHMKEAGADDKAERNNTSESVEDGMKENDQNADGELESIAIKEEAIVQLGNAAALGVNGPSRAIEHRIGTDGREKKFESEDLLHKQLVKTHPSFTLIYKCPLCPQSIRYRKQHMRVHHAVEYDAEEHRYLVRYKCHCCSKLFQQKRKLLEHQKTLHKSCDQCRMRFKTKKALKSHMAIHRGNKSYKCEDCGLECRYPGRLEEHRMRYHSPTSTQALKIMDCPYCPLLFINPSNRKRHIAIKHVQSELKIICGHCPVQVTGIVQLRKHCKAVHPEERVTFKCSECEKFYLKLQSLKDHYEKHRKEAEEDNKTKMNSTSEPVEEGVEENGQTVDQNADGDLVSIVIKEEGNVQIGNAPTPGVSATTGIKDNSLNFDELLEQRARIQIKQESLDNC